MSALSVMDSDALQNLCRCCLSPNTVVSLVDDEIVIQNFVDITTLQITAGDGLPQMLCADCYAIMNSACQFRNQCIKMDSELRYQLDTLQRTVEEREKQSNDDDADFGSNPFKQLAAIIKKEPRCEDEEEDYYVVVVNPKDAEASKKTLEIKQEVDDDYSETIPMQQSNNQSELENRIVSYISDTKVPVNVPDTILENEEGTEQEVFEGMDVDEMTNLSQEEHIPVNEDTQEIPDNCTLEGYTSALVKDIQSNNIIKILTASKDGTILLQNSEGIEYLADGQLITNEDGDDLMGQEIIYCEGESQFQILKCDGSELVIEYANDGQISTVLQQEDGTFLCDCGEQFEDLTEYENHQNSHHAAEHQCNLCGKTLESEEILAGHTLLHNNTNLQVPCPICNQQVKRSTLTQHIKYYHNNIKPSCDICDKTFANHNNLKRHMTIHSGIREFVCDICRKGFNQKIALQMHKLTHMNPYACSQCEKTFDKKDDLIHHKESDECTKSKITKIKDELMKTIKQVVKTNSGKELGFACSLCKKMFSVESALGQHIEKFHMADPMDCLCADCGEVLPSKREMQSHMLAHKTYKSKNAKRFECSSCKKGCSSQAMLTMHERVHTNERPYPCQLCLLRFKTKTHLRTHQLTHTREKKFGCSVCMKFFALKGNLVVHLRTHTGERPYVCDICNESFIDSKYLKKHKLKKHNFTPSTPPDTGFVKLKGSHQPNHDTHMVLLK